MFEVTQFVTMHSVFKSFSLVVCDNSVVSHLSAILCHYSHIDLLSSVVLLPVFTDHVSSFCRSSDFRPSYAHLGELKAFALPGVPMLAAMATVTKVMRKEIVEVLEMNGCAVLSVSPNKPNIFYSVKRRSGGIDEVSGFLTADLLSNNIKVKRVIVYCQSLDMCANLFIHFMCVLGDQGYYPPGAE